MCETKKTLNFIFAILLLFYSAVINADQTNSETEATKTNEATKEILDKVPSTDTPADSNLKSDNTAIEALSNDKSDNEIQITDVSSKSASVMTPDAVARDVTEKLISQFYKYSAEFRRNEKLMFEQIEQILYNTVAFKEVTKSVMGKHVAKANEAQISKFTTVLRESLIQFYSKIFLEFDAEKFTIQKIDAVAQTTIDDYLSGKIRLIPVELVVAKGSEKYPIKYSMIKSDNQWKLKNIIFNGINIGIQLRNQFYDFYNRSRNIDSAIELWLDRMTSRK